MIGMVSPMLQEVFCRLADRPSRYQLYAPQRRAAAHGRDDRYSGPHGFRPFGLLPSRRDDGFSRSIQEPVPASRRLYAGCRSGSLQDDSPTDPGSEGRRFGAGSQVQASNHCLENASPNHPGLEGDTYPIDGIGGLHVQKSPDGISDRTGNTRLGGDLFHPGRSAPAKRSRLCSYGTGDLW